MKKVNVVRAWRDREYRQSLSSEARAALPQNPAGIVSVDDDALRSITGGCGGTTCSCGGGGGFTTILFSCTSGNQQCP